MDKRKAIIKDINEYLAGWGSMYCIQISAHIEEIINKHFNHSKKRKMRDIKYWTEELTKMHPTDYIDLLQAIQDHHSMKCYKCKSPL